MIRRSTGDTWREADPLRGCYRIAAWLLYVAREASAASLFFIRLLGRCKELKRFMKQSAMQDKGVSPTSAVAENLKSAGATIQEGMANAGATINAQVEKMKAGDEEGRMQADLTKDRRQADAADRAEAKKADIHTPAAGGAHQHHGEEHPPPFTKTPFV